MVDIVKVRIFGPDGTVLAEGQHPLPLTIGRGVEANFVVPDPETKISRIHAIIDVRDGTLILTDRSTNGTTYRGDQIHNESVTIRDRDAFSLQSFRAEIERTREAVEPVAFHAAVLLKGRERDFPIGPRFLALLVDGQKLRMEEVEPMPPEVILAYYKHVGREAFAIIGVKDGFGTLTTTPDAKKRKLTINLGVPAGGTEALRPLDVIAVGRTRIEILKRGERALRCKNITCELLNPYEAAENCKYCGHRLIEAATRVVLG